MARRALPITLSSHAPEISFDEVAWRVGQANAILMRAEERLRLAEERLRARQLSTEPELSTGPVDNLPKEEARKPRPKVGEL